jgi:hypothetical protein
VRSFLIGPSPSGSFLRGMRTFLDHSRGRVYAPARVVSHCGYPASAGFIVQCEEFRKPRNEAIAFRWQEWVSPRACLLELMLRVIDMIR